MVSVHSFFDRDEIERRKQLVRDLWAGKPVDHVPAYLVVSDPVPGPTGGRLTVREQFQDADKQLAVALRTAELSWQAVPDGDYIPAMRPDVGCSCLAEYLEHTPPPRSLDLSYPYSKGDLDAIKETCRKQALVYMADFPDRPAEAVEAYRQIMERMAPDVVVIPTLCVTTRDDVPAIHRRLREIAQEYARRMDWGWE